jgi:multisubunit Na+/H+ antiporter MnhE subunit
MGNFMYFIYEGLMNLLGLVRIIVYYLIESLVFGLVINIIWLYLLQKFFEFNIDYLTIVGILLIYRLIFFDVTKQNTNNIVEHQEEEIEEK